MGHRFLSCEDVLPNIAGVFNPIAALTALPMLAVPLNALVKSTSINFPPLHIHLLAMFALFCGNLYSHVFGLSNPIFDRLPSWYGITGAYMLWKLQRHHDQRKDALLSVALVGWALVQWFLMNQYPTEFRLEQRFYLAMEALTLPYIVITIGRLSWTDTGLKRNFYECCLLLASLHVVTSLESGLCSFPVLPLIFHGLVDHPLIALTFFRVATLMMKLVRRARTEALSDNKRKS